MPGPFAFISYTHDARSQRLAGQLCERLKEFGITAWYDGHLNGGEDWSKAIDAKIDSATFIIVIVTPKSAASHYVTYEWSLALGKNKPTIPVLLDGDINTMHPRMSLIQHRDFRIQFEEQWELLFRDITRILKNLQPASDQDTQPTRPAELNGHSRRLSAWDKQQVENFFNIMPPKLLRKLNPVDILDFHVYGRQGTGTTIFARIVQLNDLMERRPIDTFSDKHLANLLVNTCDGILSMRLAPVGDGDSDMLDPDHYDQGRLALQAVREAYCELQDYINHNYPDDSLFR